MSQPSFQLILPSFPITLRTWTVIAGAGLLWVASKIIARRKRNPRGLPLPPGPKGLPVIGNLLQLPQTDPAIQYDRLCKEYGDILYLEAVGQPIVMLGSLEKANDILDKRSANSSDRPTLTAFEMLDVNWAFTILQYGPEWRAHRKAFHQVLNPNALPRFTPILDEEMSIFFKKLQRDPTNFVPHVKDLLGYTIMRLTYGFNDPEVNKQLLHDGETIIGAFSDVTWPGRYLVNTFPILKHVPMWFPGAGFRRKFEEYRQVSNRVCVDAFERAKEDLKTGRRSDFPSLIEDFIGAMPDEDDPTRDEYAKVARNICAITYGGGADTTASSLLAVFLAMAMHPEIQARAQKELDAVVGKDRLPTLDDQDSLPYVTALVTEAKRCHTVTPVGFAHVTAQHDEYDGFFIPKGTYVMANTCGIMHDPAVYKTPLQFNPEHYLTKDGQFDRTVRAPEVASFGYGRRICPGRFLANNTLWLVTACLLSTFDILQAKDESGNPIALNLECEPGTVAVPNDFKCEIRLRSPERAKLFS